jgi:transcription termination factor Rho
MAETRDQAHLADLHARAAELGIPGYRLLRREELIGRIEGEGGAAPPTHPRKRLGAERPAAPEGSPRGERGPEPARERERLEERPEAAAEPVTGVLEVTGQGHGFLRLRGAEPDADDVYVSASQIRRCELQPGDRVTGPARSPRRGERHRALVHIDLVNGEEPLSGERTTFESLTPVLPSRRISLELARDDVLTRAVDLLAPIALGQRVLILAAPRSGRTTLLRGIARAVAASETAELVVLLIDERPEEAAAWADAIPDGEITAAPADVAPGDQVRVAELALQRARRRVEAGADVVLVVDSLSRLAVAAEGVEEVKRLFGSGRALAEPDAGSLTVIATVVAGAEDDGAAERAVVTTENALIRLDPRLAASGVVPALAAADCRVSNEEELRAPDELEAVRRLRAELGEGDPADAARLLRERIEGSASNAELLASI